MLLCQQCMPGILPRPDPALERHRRRCHGTMRALAARRAIPMHWGRLHRQEGMAERQVARDGSAARTRPEPGLRSVPGSVA